MNAISHAAKTLLRHLLLRDHSLTVKLLVYSGLLVMVPMLVVGFISYHRSSEVLEKEAKQYSWQIIEQVKTHVEYYVRDFEISTLKMINHPDMQKFLSMQTIEEIEQSGIRKSVQQILFNAAFSRGDISGITVILDNLQTIDTAGFNSYTPVYQLMNEYWYQAVPSNGDPMLISRFIRVSDGHEPVISIVKRLISPRTLQPIGMIITDVNFKRIQEIAQMVTIGRTGYMSILDSTGHYVYHPDVRYLGQKADLEPLQQLLQSNSGSYVLNNEVRQLLTYSRSSFLGWSLLTLIPYNELTQGSGYIGRTIVWTTSIALAIAYIIGITFAAGIIRPIRHLQQYMKRIEVGDFDAKMKVESRDEIGLLTHGFNKMVEHLSQLLEEIYFTRLRETEMHLRQKETELRVLQTQVNPHFLYNALETIRGMALDKDMDDIAEMSASLSRLFQYNLRESSSAVRLSSEIAVCQLYLQIQKYRFEDRLEFEFHIPDWAQTQAAATFSLQPIVENCIKHGADPLSGVTRISITACQESDTAYVLRIADDGPGISDDILSALRYDLMHKDIILGGPRIGMVNVHRRCEYMFGEGFGLSIESEAGKGTTVSIRLPMNIFEMERGEAYAHGIACG